MNTTQTAATTPAETVTVGKDGNVWRWYRNPGAGLRKYGKESFRTQAEAVNAAQSIARCYGAQYAGVEVAP